MTELSAAQATKMLKVLDDNHAIMRQILQQVLNGHGSNGASALPKREKRKVIRRTTKKAAKKVVAKAKKKTKKKAKKKTKKKAKKKKSLRPMDLEIYSGKGVPLEALRVLSITLHDLRDFRHYNVGLNTTRKYLVEYANRLNTWLVGGTDVKLRRTEQMTKFINQARRRRTGKVTCRMELSLGKSFIVYTISSKGVSVGLETDNKGFARKWVSWGKQMQKKYGAEFNKAYVGMSTDVVSSKRKKA